MRYVLLLLFVGACAPVTSQGLRFAPAASPHERALQRTFVELVGNSEPYAAPEKYADLWRDALSVCSCRPKVQLYDIQWRKLIGSAPRERGEFWIGEDVMFIMSADVNDAKVVRHEMLHAILGGDPDHRDKAWRRL